jgi:hypothetical protein
MPLPPLYKIHPAIGIARLGNASTYFIGPEIPGVRPTGVPPYKEGGKIKPQAARFRVFEYVDQKGQYAWSREISLDEKDVTKMRWTVHLANRKASFFEFNGLAGAERPPQPLRNNNFTGDRRDLEIDPKERSISGKNATPIEFSKGTSKNPTSERWPNPKPFPEITSLGRILTDDRGRLLVIGGSGISAKVSGANAIGHYANNDSWFDDVSDGPVTVYLELNKKIVSVAPAWVICAPPDFAPHMANVVTLYDSMYDLAARELNLPTNEALYTTGALKGLSQINEEFKKAGKPGLSKYEPDFATEIYPILYWSVMTMFVFEPSIGKMNNMTNWTSLGSKDVKHSGDRNYVFLHVRAPDTNPMSPIPYMPKLLGDEPYRIHSRARLTLTPTQYALLKQWANGKFLESPKVPPTPSQTITPEGLDRAALENCVGGAFYPGIEAGWLTRNSKIFVEPFRIKHNAPSGYLGETGIVVSAGYFTRQMAVPWQADFRDCKSEMAERTTVWGQQKGLWGWWPAQRPDHVFPLDTSEADFLNDPPNPVPWFRATRDKNQIMWPSTNKEFPSYEEMVQNWYKFGFVLEKKRNVFIEDERDPTIP